MTHSWFVNFDKNFNANLPLWFGRWWTPFGSITEIFPRPLMGSFKYFTSVFKVDSHNAKFPTSLHFDERYKVPQILKWKYVKEGDVLTCHQYVKWWDKFSHTQSVIDNVSWEFLATNSIPNIKAQSPATPKVQPTVPQLTVYAPATSFAKTSAEKKKSPFDDLSGDALYALLK